MLITGFSLPSSLCLPRWLVLVFLHLKSYLYLHEQIQYLMFSSTAHRASAKIIFVIVSLSRHYNYNYFIVICFYEASLNMMCNITKVIDQQYFHVIKVFFKNCNTLVIIKAMTVKLLTVKLYHIKFNFMQGTGTLFDQLQWQDHRTHCSVFPCTIILYDKMNRIVN